MAKHRSHIGWVDITYTHHPSVGGVVALLDWNTEPLRRDGYTLTGTKRRAEPRHRADD